MNDVLNDIELNWDSLTSNPRFSALVDTRDYI
jgi:hypothetical protein